MIYPGNGKHYRYQKTVQETTREHKKLACYIYFLLWIKRLLCKVFYNRVVPIHDEEDKELIEDIDCDYLENKMMNKLTKEKQMIKNWHTVLMRIQMIHAFKLSMRIQD